MKSAADPYKHPPNSYKLKSSSKIFIRNHRYMYKDPYTNQKIGKSSGPSRDLVPWWSSRSRSRCRSRCSSRSIETLEDVGRPSGPRKRRSQSAHHLFCPLGLAGGGSWLLGLVREGGELQLPGRGAPSASRGEAGTAGRGHQSANHRSRPPGGALAQGGHREELWRDELQSRPSARGIRGVAVASAWERGGSVGGVVRAWERRSWRAWERRRLG
jgi:hypothetical protein